MKKYFFVGILFLMIVVTVSASTKEDTVNNLNSKNLFVHLKWMEDKKPYKICNVDYCDYLKYKNLEKAVKVYVDDYINYVKEKTDEETSVKVALQGFEITNIYYRY